MFYEIAGDNNKKIKLFYDGAGNNEDIRLTGLYFKEAGNKEIKLNLLILRNSRW